MLMAVIFLRKNVTKPLDRLNEDNLFTMANGINTRKNGGKMAGILGLGRHEDADKTVLTEKEIVTKVIDYVTAKENVTRFNLCERGEITREQYGDEIKRYIYDNYDVDDDVAESVYKQFCSFIWGYYIIEPLINDPAVSDIRIVDPDHIYTKKKGIRCREDIRFADNKDYERFIERCILRCHINLGTNNSIAKWTDKSSDDWILRFDAITKMLSGNGYTNIHIRKHPKKKKTMDVLTSPGENLLTKDMYRCIKKLQEEGGSFLVCGDNSAGKTTLLNGMIEEIPMQYSIFCAQEADELFSLKEREFCSYHVVEARGESKISYSLKDLGQAGLTMDTDVYMLGEIKGDEASEMLRAVHTGAIAYMSTHSHSIPDAYMRLYDYIKRTMNYSMQEIMYMLRYVRYGIYVDKYRVKDIAEAVWNDEKKELEYRYIYKDGKRCEDGLY